MEKSGCLAGSCSAVADVLGKLLLLLIYPSGIGRTVQECVCACVCVTAASALGAQCGIYHLFTTPECTETQKVTY